MILGVVASNIPTTPSYDVLSASLNASEFDTTPTGNIVAFREFNGYSGMLYDTGDVVHKYDSVTGQNIGDIALASPADSASLLSTAQDFHISSDGTKIMYISNDTTLFARTMSVADDLSTAGSATSGDWPTSVGGLTLAESRALKFQADGLRYWIMDRNQNAVVEFTLSSAWDPTSTHTYVDHILLTDDRAAATLASGIDISPDGKKLIVIENNEDYLMQYTLTTAWRIGGGHTYDGAIDLNVPLTVPQGVAYSADGARFFIPDTSQNAIKQWDI